MPTGRYSDALANALLDHVFGGGDYERPAYLYIGAIKDNGYEVSGGGYARAAVLNSQASFPAAADRAKSNANAIPFPTATADWTTDGSTIAAIGIYTAASGGSPIATIPLAGAFEEFFARASTDVIACTAHGFANGQRVRVEALDEDIALPGGLSANTSYYVRDATTDSFKLAASSGGAAINITSDGSGYVFLHHAREVLAGDTFSLAAGALVISHL